MSEKSTAKASVKLTDDLDLQVNASVNLKLGGAIEKVCEQQGWTADVAEKIRIFLRIAPDTMQALEFNKEFDLLKSDQADEA